MQSILVCVPPPYLSRRSRYMKFSSTTYRCPPPSYPQSLVTLASDRSHRAPPNVHQTPLSHHSCSCSFTLPCLLHYPLLVPPHTLLQTLPLRPHPHHPCPPLNLYSQVLF